MPDKNLETRILKLLEKSPEGAQASGLAAALDLTRHTVAKYLLALEAGNRIHYRLAGRTKLWKLASSAMRIRYLVGGDLDSIINIVLGISRSAGTDEHKKAVSYLRETALRHIERNEPLMNLAAELDGRLIGFIIGEVRAWEFGQTEKTGWINALGVDPKHRGKGAGKKLGEALLSNFRALGITRVRTLVNWYEGDLLSYFRMLGFNVFNMTPLEAKIGLPASAKQLGGSASGGKLPHGRKICNAWQAGTGDRA
ncbi:MAG: GNAT family N-acetyltransferase [Elusimicrobia bacterium]|nr:GNAT family N-acetyltransferase [Elusimicrobiota bacterium]